MATPLAKTGLAEANGARLYHEIRGEGPAVVFISGAGGDAGGYEGVAELLADTYTVVTYDRRGNSRSPKPDGWDTTSIVEQADDCAALIEALGLDRPVVFGSSLGGTILIGFLERHAHLLRGAIVHEPGLPSMTPGAAEFRERLAELFTGEPAADVAATMDRVNRWMLGDAAVDAIPADVRSRIDANREVETAIESRAWMSYVPDEAALAAVEVPVHAAFGEETTTPLTWIVDSAEWVSKATGGPLHTFPGGHNAYIVRPPAFADALRPILSSMS